MCCFIASIVLFGPRIVMFFWWLFDPARFDITFTSFIWPLLGFIFVPWTTMAYILVFPGGVNGLDWLWIGLALLLDIISYGGGVYSRKKKS
ncbi:hypothetical protein ACFL2B_00310 [Patescibacteria group bacterium]